MHDVFGVYVVGECKQRAESNIRPTMLLQMLVKESPDNVEKVLRLQAAADDSLQVQQYSAQLRQSVSFHSKHRQQIVQELLFVPVVILCKFLHKISAVVSCRLCQRCLLVLLQFQD